MNNNINSVNDIEEDYNIDLMAQKYDEIYKSCNAIKNHS